MGYYLEVPGHRAKATQLEDLYGAEPFSGSYEEVPEGKTAVCVVQNGLFDACGIAYDKDEFEAFNEPDDPRQKDWVLLSTSKVVELEPKVAAKLS